MKIALLFLMAVAALHLLAGCRPAQSVDKLCFQHDDGTSWCRCRDAETGEHVECQ